MNSVRTKWILGLVLAGCGLLAFLWSYCRATQAQGVKLQFQKVGLLDRAGVLCTFHQGPAYMDVSKDAALRSVLYRYEAKPIFPTAPAAVCPNGTRLYLASSKELLEFNGSLKLLRRIPVEAFQFEEPNYVFGGPMYASNEKLWFTINRPEHRDDQALPVRSYVVQWLPTKSPDTKIAGPNVVGRWAVDCSSGRIFMGGSQPGIFDFGSHAFSEQDWPTYPFIDFKQTHKIVMSRGANADLPIIVVDLSSGSKTELPVGGCALWGGQNHVYFLRGRRELWRCGANGNDLEIVYRGPPINPGPNFSLPGFLFDHTGTFLAIYCVDTSQCQPATKRLVTIDLATNQYREEIHAGFPCMAWLPARNFGQPLTVEEASFSDDKQLFIELYDAVFFWNEPVIRTLLGQGAEVNKTDALGNTALHYAAELGRKNIAEILISSGANVNAANVNQQTPLHTAVEGPIYEHCEPAYVVDRLATVNVLLSTGASADAKDKFGHRPLDIARRSGKHQIANALIRSASGSSEKIERMSLRQAVRTGNIDLVRSLILAGADVDAENEHRKSVLETAWFISGPMRELLINHGANVNVKFTTGFYPLHLAVMQGDEQLAKLLISRGAKVNVTNESGVGPLHLAVQQQEVTMARLLLDSGADPNLKDAQGSTPLHIAVYWDYRTLVSLLVANGADVSVEDAAGFTPLELAEMHPPEVAQPLIQRLSVGEQAEE